MEIAMLDTIQRVFGCPFLDAVMPMITMLGSGGALWIVTAVILLCTKKYRKYGLMMGLGLLMGLLISNLTLKPLIARARPFLVNPDVVLLIRAPKDFSFPSGHTQAAFLASTVLFYMHRKIGIAALILSALIAFSRMYLYVHYPSDILAGLVIGVLLACLSIWLVERFYPQNKNQQSTEP